MDNLGNLYDYLHIERYEQSIHTKKVEIDFHDLYEYNMELADYVLANPEWLHESRGQFSLDILRLVNLVETKPIRNIKSYELYKLMQLKGVVSKSTIAQSRISVASFKCSKCGAQHDITQTEQFLEYPTRCGEGECKSKNFTFWREKTEYTDIQHITLQESPESLPAGETPINIEIELDGDLVNMVSPGDRCTVVGVTQVLQKSKTDKSLDLRRSFIAHSIVVDNRTDFLDDMPESERIKFDAWVKEPDWFSRLSSSISPMTYGYDYIKKSLVLLLAGAPATILGVERRRGDSHLFLIGDPGTNKTQFAMFASKVSPRGIFVTAGGATRVGLTASATKDNDTWVIEAGAVVLADNGVCCIDELDKMREEDRGAMHPAMEQQIVTKHAAGMAVTLNARCSVIATANPKDGRYDPGKTVGENINLDAPLLSRFDLIFIIQDIPEEHLDREIAKTILRRSNGAKGVIPVEALKRFFSYCKQVNPTLSKQVEDYLIDYYVDVRKKTKHNYSVTITPRQLESLERLTRASARVHMREQATLEDAGNAIELYNRMLQDAGVDPVTKEISIDLLMTGKPVGRMNKLKAIHAYINSEAVLDDGGRLYVEYDDVMSGLLSTGSYSRVSANDHLDEMERVFPPLIYRNGNKIYPC